MVENDSGQTLAEPITPWETNTLDARKPWSKEIRPGKMVSIPVLIESTINLVGIEVFFRLEEQPSVDFLLFCKHPFKASLR